MYRLDRLLPQGRFLVWLIAGMALAMEAGAATPAAKGGDQIGFTAMQLDVSVAGEFKSFTAAIGFDPARPESGKAEIGIDLASVSTGSDDADTLIKGRDFFDVAHGPRATFTSTRITRDGPDHYRALGRLTLKGRVADLAVPFTARSGPDGLWLEGSVPVSRLAYKVGVGEWADTGTLADSVQIHFRLHLAH